MNEDFDTLYSEHYGRVFRICRHYLQNVEEAHDATQEVFIRAFCGYEKFDRDRSFKAWIDRIAVNYCLDILRGRQREQSMLEKQQEAVEDSDKSPIVEVVVKNQAVSGCLSELSEEDYAIVFLKDILEYTWHECKEGLKLTYPQIGDLRYRHSKAHRQLRTCLKKHGVDIAE